MINQSLWYPSVYTLCIFKALWYSMKYFAHECVWRCICFAKLTWYSGGKSNEITIRNCVHHLTINAGRDERFRNSCVLFWNTNTRVPMSSSWVCQYRATSRQTRTLQHPISDKSTVSALAIAIFHEWSWQPKHLVYVSRWETRGLACDTSARNRRCKIRKFFSLIHVHTCLVQGTRTGNHGNFSLCRCRLVFDLQTLRSRVSTLLLDLCRRDP